MICPKCNSPNVRTERVPTKPPAEESICGACHHWWRVVVPHKRGKARPRSAVLAPVVNAVRLRRRVVAKLEVVREGDRRFVESPFADDGGAA